VDAAAAVAAVSPKKFQFAIGAQATVGQFGGPASVAVAPDGTVYVADSGNHRIQRFSASGTLPQRVGVIGQRRRTVQLS
jgi:sugar lactone lactonase YvrE